MRIDAHYESAFLQLFYSCKRTNIGTSVGTSITWVNSKGAYLTVDTDCIFMHLTQLITIQIAIIMIITITKDSKRLVNHPDRENPNALKILPSQLVFNAAAIACESFATFFILSSWVQRGMDIFGI